ncbi:MAG: L,D-transpeptidase family protein [Pyrinomonadaceae bacterium]
MRKTRIHRANFNYRAAYVGTALLLWLYIGGAAAQTRLPQTLPTASDLNESERSDKLTGGRIETAEFKPDQPDIRLTLNVPSFRLTLWQNGKEVTSYFVGVGMKEHPLYIGEREATEIIWNPAWIPPPSDWVLQMKTVTPGEVIKASDPRNPLGKMKIPLGDRYLIHQAAKATDLGNLVSHGCVRVLRSDLYDLAEKIIAARNAPVSPKRIEAAKRSSRMLVVRLDEPVPVDINYDTLVVEDGVLHIYPDVYGRGTNRTARLRAELESSNVNVSNLDEKTMRGMLAKVTRRTQFVVDKSSIERGTALEDGKVLPLIPKTRPKAAAAKSKAAQQGEAKNQEIFHLSFEIFHLSFQHVLNSPTGTTAGATTRTNEK